MRHPRLEPILCTRSLFYAPFHQVDCPDRRYRYLQYGQLIASGRSLRQIGVPNFVDRP